MFSLMATEALAAGEKTLIIVDQNELVDQAVDKLMQATGIRAEREKAEHSASLTAPVVVATVQSLANRLDKFSPDHFGLVIADEADKSISAQWQKVLNRFDGSAKVAGFTATPHRTDQKNLGCYYENVVERENLFSLINKGFLSPVHVLMLPIKIDLSAVHVTDGDFDANELDEIIGPHLLKIAEVISCHAAFRKTLVFLPLVKTCQKFAEIGRSIGLSVDYVHGRDADRSEKLERFKAGGFDVLANSSLLTRGYDDTSIDCIVPIRPTKSITLYCLDSKTEVLTSTGWTTYPGLHDTVAAFDTKTGRIQFTPITGIVRRETIPGECFLSLKGQSVDIRVTDNHRMLYDHKRKTGWKFKTAMELSQLKDTSYIPVSGIGHQPGVPLTDAELRFIGWVMTDGCINKINKAITITQGEHQPWIDSIQKCIDGCGFKSTKSAYWRKDSFNQTSRCVRWTISHGKPRGTGKHLQGWSRLSPWLSKDFHHSLMFVSPEQFDVLIEAIHLGDGSKQSSAKGWTRRSYHICSANRNFIERLQIVAIMCGYRANLSFHNTQNHIWMLHLKKQSWVRVGGSYRDRPNWKIESKREPCWCVENELGTIVTRRNGKVAIVGNCQMIGRGTRLSAGKQNMLLIDLLYQSTKHMVCRPANLIAGNDLQARAITEVAAGGMPADIADAMPVDLQSMASDATEQREQSLRKQLEAHKNKKRKSISADEFALEHGVSGLADYEPAMDWERREVTTRQATYLKQAKIDLTTVRGQGHASKLLDVFFREVKKPRMAAPKAVALMERMPGLCHQIGINNLDNVTAAQAGRFFAALKERKEQLV